MSGFPWWYGPRWPFRYFVPSLKHADNFTKPLIWGAASPEPQIPQDEQQQSQQWRAHSERHMRLLFFGDFMPMGSAPKHVDEALLELFRGADAVIGNLETPVLQRQTLWHRLASYVFHNISEHDFEGWLAALHISPCRVFLSLANNHCFDWGDHGYRSTLAALHRLGVTPLGDGSCPRVAHLAPGIGITAWTHWLNLSSDEEAVTTHADILQAGQGSIKQEHGLHTLIGVPHWDYEFNFYPSQETQQHAATLLDTGFDVLVGTHSHTPQPVVLYAAPSVSAPGGTEQMDGSVGTCHKTEKGKGAQHGEEGSSASSTVCSCEQREGENACVHSHPVPLSRDELRHLGWSTTETATTTATTAQATSAPSRSPAAADNGAKRDEKEARVKLVAYSLGDFNGFPLPPLLQQRDHTVGQLLSVTIDRQTGHVVDYEVTWAEWQPCQRRLVRTHIPPSAFQAREKSA